LAVIVSDTSPIRALAHLGRIGLLHNLFGIVLLPPAVDEELRHPPTGLPLVDVRELGFISIRAPNDHQRVEDLMRSLDPGESEALALALELGVSVILIDEAAGGAMAVHLGLQPVGVLGTLVRAKQRGLIDGVGSLMECLESEIGFFISEQLRTEILRRAGEL
jgi:predicted nucleic acid-binding protein